MAGETVIDIILKATNKTKQALTEPIHDLEDLAGAVRGAMPLWAAMATAASTALFEMTEHSIEAADEVYKMSQKFGGSAETISTMGYAAGLTGVSMEDLASGMGKLDKAAVSSVQGNQETAKAFQILGISVTDASGKLKSTDTLMLEVADTFKGLEDGPAKAKLAMDLFGKSGDQLIPFLNQGAAGIQAMQSQAEALGLSISGDFAQRASNFSTTIGAITAGTKGAANGFAEDMLPALQVLADDFEAAVEKGGFLRELFNELTAVVGYFSKIVIEEFQNIVAFINEVTSLFVGLGVAIYTTFTDGPKAGLQALKTIGTDVTAIEKKTSDDVKKIWGDGPTGPVPPDPVAHKRNLDAILKANRDAVAEAKLLHDQEIEAYKNADLSKIQAELDFYHAKKSLNVQDLQDVQKLEQDKAAILKVAHDAEIEGYKLAGRNAVVAEMAKYQAIGSLNKQEAEDYKKLQAMKAEMDHGALQAFAGYLGQIATLSDSNNQVLVGIGRAAGIAQAEIDGGVAAANALANVPYPYNFAVAALMEAATQVQVAKIAGVNFAEGGEVPGSSFTGDKVRANLNSGEEVFTTKDRRDNTAMLKGAMALAQQALATAQNTVLQVQQTLLIGGRPFYQGLWDAAMSGELQLPARAIIGKRR